MPLRGGQLLLWVTLVVRDVSFDVALDMNLRWLNLKRIHSLDNHDGTGDIRVVDHKAELVPMVDGLRENKVEWPRSRDVA